MPCECFTNHSILPQQGLWVAIGLGRKRNVSPWRRHRQARCPLCEIPFPTLSVPTHGLDQIETMSSEKENLVMESQVSCCSVLLNSFIPVRDPPPASLIPGKGIEPTCKCGRDLRPFSILSSPTQLILEKIANPRIEFLFG